MLQRTETQRRISVADYCSAMGSLLLTRELEIDPSKHNQLIINCAMSCLKRVTSPDVKAILRSIIAAPQPFVALLREELRIVDGGMEIIDFLKIGTSVGIMGML